MLSDVQPRACPEAESLGRRRAGARRAAAPEDAVAAARDRAFDMMRAVGADVAGVVEVTVDPALPFMGYTRPFEDHFRIVVAGRALDSGMLPALLVHEMSHVRRMVTGHASHRESLLLEVAAAAGVEAMAPEQQKTIHDLLNNVQDLYADDIAFRALAAGGVPDGPQLSRFLQDWVTEEPARTGDPGRDAWANAWLLANNARALAQMERHRVADVGGAGAAANARFLARMPPGAAQPFEHFRGLLRDLPEEPTTEALRRLLTGYLDRFLEVARELAPPAR